MVERSTATLTPQLSNQYPAWLEANKTNCPPDSYAKYQKQLEIVTEIVRIYEGSETTSNEELRRVAELMTAMQETGNPPDDIIKELAPDMEFGPDGPK